MGDLATYTRRHPHFPTELPPLLQSVARRGAIADIGCGDGALLAELDRAGLLDDTAYAVDLSDGRVRHAEKRVPSAIGVVADGADTGLPDGAVDGVVCSQVIEHVDDPSALVAEIARILRPGGWWYIGSVLRAPRSFWIYRVDGEWRLDPTHVREYRSRDEFEAAVRHPDLALSELRVTPFRFPLSHLLARAARRSSPLPFGGRISVRPLGYSRIEAAGIKSF